MRPILVTCFLLALWNATLLAQSPPLQEKQSVYTSYQDIDTYVRGVMDAYELPGVSLAIIKDGNIIHQNIYGYANLEHKVPISNKSIFRVYSLTKLFVAVGVFQLIEEDKLSLEDPISLYVSSLPNNWQAIKIKHLLTHSSGLPDMSPIPEFQDLTREEATAKVFAQNIKFEPGASYDYNQTGFWVLKEILEHVTGISLEEFILSNQFDESQNIVFFSTDSRDIVPNRATAYFPFVKGYQTIEHPYLNGDYAYAMNGLNITLAEFISWDKKLRDNQVISEQTKKSMWSPYPYAKSNKAFSYGWDIHSSNQTVSYGFSGSLVTAYRTFPEKNMSIIFLSNGMGQWFDIEDIMDRIASLVLNN